MAVKSSAHRKHINNQRNAVRNTNANASLRKMIIQGKKAPFPEFITPMLCTPTRVPMDDPRFLHEIKFDGYRILSYVRKGKVRLASRGRQDYTDKYPLVVTALSKLAVDVVLDGEVVVFNEAGNPDFKALQNYNGKRTPIVYCIFDILWLDGYELMELPLETRKSILATLLAKNDILRFTDSYDDGPALYDEMRRLGWEGIISKERDSPYVPGQRKEKWLKTPIKKGQEFVIGGWSESDKARSFRGLLFGAYVNGTLTWIGRSGSGFKEHEMAEIFALLKKHERAESPFSNKVLDTKGAKSHWIDPVVVGIFEYSDLILYDDGRSPRIRKPAVYKGLRTDKNPKDVILEIPKSISAVEQAVDDDEAAPPRSTRHLTKTVTKPAGKKNNIGNWRYIDEEPKQDLDTLDFGDCTVDVYNIHKDVWPGFTKLELLNWYHTMAPHILPYLKDRPVTLNPRLKGANAPGFYLHGMIDRPPECADIYTSTRRHEEEGKAKGERIRNLVINNEATLLWTVNLGCIDCNPWNSRVSSIDTPDYIVIDLDPPKGAEKEAYIGGLRRTAVAAKKYLQKMHLQLFVKTSGRTGLHFLIPCEGFTWEQCRKIAEACCDGIHALVPDDTTREEQKKDRGNNIYLDASQNDYGDTARCVYCVAPHKNKNVSTPLELTELSKVDPDDFNLHTIEARIKKKGDLFKGLFNAKLRKKNSKTLRATLDNVGHQFNRRTKG